MHFCDARLLFSTYISPIDIRGLYMGLPDDKPNKRPPSGFHKTFICRANMRASPSLKGPRRADRRGQMSVRKDDTIRARKKLSKPILARMLSTTVQFAVVDA